MAATLLRDMFRSRAMDDFPGTFAHQARPVIEDLRRDWDRTSREAAENGRLEGLHATRDDYHDLLQGHIRLLEEYLSLTKLHQRAFGPNAVKLAELTRALDDLRGLHDELFPRWQTREDLTQILIERFSLPAEKLRELASSQAPPRSWIEETADPFAAETTAA